MNIGSFLFRTFIVYIFYRETYGKNESFEENDERFDLQQEKFNIF